MNEAYNNLTKTQQKYVDSIRSIGEGWGYDLTKANWTRKELVAISMMRQSNDDVPNWIVKDKSRRVSRGVYFIPEVAQTYLVPRRFQHSEAGLIEDDPQSDEILQAVEELNI